MERNEIAFSLIVAVVIIAFLLSKVALGDTPLIQG
jgi:hypothetical protein